MTAPGPGTHRLRLHDGTRVVLCPDRSVPSLGVSLHRGAGFRDDPHGRAGLAHLVEHLVHEGSSELEGTTHAEWIEASGGTVNAATHQDHTVFHQTVPPAALERTLHLEAARTRAPRIDERSLRAQTQVVGEEIRSVVHGRPYGGFPWMSLPSTLYEDFPCSHNGYGDPEHLLETTVEECLRFVERHYTPARTVLTLTGNFHEAAALEMIHQNFGSPGHVPAPPESARPSGRTALTRPRTVHESRAGIPFPALALAAATPDPGTDPDPYLRWVLLSLIMGEGPPSRLQRRLVQEEGVAFSVSAGCGLFGTALETAGPDTLVLSIVHRPDAEPDRMCEIVDRELAHLVEAPPRQEEITSAVARFATRFHRDHDPAGARARALGRGELHFADPALPFTLPERLRALGPDDVARAAGELRSAPRGELVLTPSGSAAHAPGPRSPGSAGERGST